MEQKLGKAQLREALENATKEFSEDLYELTSLCWDEGLQNIFIEKYRRMWINHCRNIAAKAACQGLSMDVAFRIFRDFTEENDII